MWKDRREKRKQQLPVKSVEEFLIRLSKQTLTLSQSSILLKRENLYVKEKKKVWKDRREKWKQWMPVNGVPSQTIQILTLSQSNIEGKDLCIVGRVLIRIKKRKVWKDRLEKRKQRLPMKSVEEFLIRLSKQILTLSQSSNLLKGENLCVGRVLIRRKKRKV